MPRANGVRMLDISKVGHERHVSPVSLPKWRKAKAALES
jgi:hypothetical protein